MGTQAVIINVTDETASLRLCQLLHLGLQDNRLSPRKTYGYGRQFFISHCAVTISSLRRGRERRENVWAASSFPVAVSSRHRDVFIRRSLNKRDPWNGLRSASFEAEKLQQLVRLSGLLGEFAGRKKNLIL